MQVIGKIAGNGGYFAYTAGFPQKVLGIGRMLFEEMKAYINVTGVRRLLAAIGIAVDRAVIERMEKGYE